MSDKQLRIGQKVEIYGKNVRGEIAYYGTTSFAVGKWVGVILDEPMGKNNGSIKGQSYFTCQENHGMFVRPSQLILLDDSGYAMELSMQEDKQPRSRLSSAGSVRSVASTTRPTAVRRKSPVKAPHSIKQNLTMTSSNSSSRLSLAGSRQSLMGSGSQLASPQTERPTSITPNITNLGAEQCGNNGNGGQERKTQMSPPEFVSTSKRESFVETGFLETLKPQFIPGHSLVGGASASEDKLHSLQQQQQQNDDLKSQVRDLTEKLETVRMRRSEDKERLREFDKMKTQFEQLQEFKLKIMDAHSQLQRDLQRTRQETKDAIEARDRHVEEMSDLAESVEMITLDKEMAEEKVETLQLELEASRERCEELQLDLEIIKAELQNKGSGAVCATIEGCNVVGGGESNDRISSYEFKQMEQQNIRLRETLVRLRDLSAHEKHEIQKMAKELDTTKSEIIELHRTKEKLSATIDELEAQVVDLQEQVDASLGAEEMVEQLADKKMELEERVKQLEEEVGELEALEEVHELLVEGNRELELDLREELDMALAAKRDMMREKDAALENILDRDQTILKFRELVQKLNDQIHDLRDRKENNLASQTSTTTTSRNTPDVLGSNSGGIDGHADLIVDCINFKQIFAESKAYTRAIDLQLRQIELSQSTEHVRLLTAYLPDTFMCRGSDHDAILVILLVSRMVFKTGIIINQARERFSPIEIVDRNAILQGHVVHQFAFKSRLLFYVHNLQAIMHQFLYGLNTCSPEILLKAGGSIPEMLAQEKTIDGVVELLKANQLDENSSIDNLEKCVAFFNVMYSVLLNGENLMNEIQLMRDCTASLTAACDSINTDSQIIQALIKNGDETSEGGLLLQFVNQNTENLKTQLKMIKRRLPQDTLLIKCGLSQKTLQSVHQTTEQIGKSMSSMFLGAKLALQTVVNSDDIDATIPHSKLMEILSLSFEKIYEQDDRGPAQNLRSLLSASNIEMAQLAQYFLDNEYEILAQQTESVNKPLAPIVLRAQFVKKQLEETKTLTATLENREAEIRQLKLAAKMKQSELSEMQIRKDLAEKKLSVLQNDNELNTKDLQKKYDETLQLLKRKEKEFEETMDHLQNDIDSLESERGLLREKLKGYSTKRGDLKASTAFDITAGSPFIAQELTLLKKAFNDERAERISLQASEMKNILNKLEPIHVPPPKDNRIIELEQELAKVKHDYIISLAKGAEFPISKLTHPNISKLLTDHQNKQKLVRQEIKKRVEYLASTVVNEYLQRKPHRSVKGDFTQFPSIELSAALKVN